MTTVATPVRPTVLTPCKECGGDWVNQSQGIYVIGENAWVREHKPECTLQTGGPRDNES